jgi:hypothetical protein
MAIPLDRNNMPRFQRKLSIYPYCQDCLSAKVILYHDDNPRINNPDMLNIIVNHPTSIFKRTTKPWDNEPLEPGEFDYPDSDPGETPEVVN